MKVLKEKIKKITAGAVLLIALGCMLVSMLGTWVLATDFFTAKETVYNVTMAELAAMIDENNAAYGKDIPVDFTRDPNYWYNFSFIVYKPENATPENPAPLVGCSHGGSSRKELQQPFYLELVRRGFVVISIDKGGNGATDTGISTPDVSGDGHGMLPAVEFGMSLPYVDETRVGITGHSAGNNACVNTLNILNAEGSEHRIRAYVSGDGTSDVARLTSEQTHDMVLTVGECKYGEFNNGMHVGTSDQGKHILNLFYPGFREESIPNGQWFTKEGAVASPEPGQPIEAENAVVFYEPSIIHVSWYFNQTAVASVIDGMYAGLGTPSGAQVIASSNTVWQLAAALGLLGIIGFFMLPFALVPLLLKRKVFSGVIRTLPSNETLGELKKLSTWLPMLVFFVPMMIITYQVYRHYTATASRYMNTSVYAAAMSTNGAAMNGLIMGIVMIGLLFVVWFLQSIFARVNKTTLQNNPFTNARLDSGSQFLKTVLLSFTVVFIMYSVVWFAFYVFHVDFHFWDWTITVTDLDHLYIILVKYFPIFALFYTVCALFNANTRFKDVPEWLSTMLCALFGAIPTAYLAWEQYSTVFTLEHVRFLDDVWVNMAACGAWKGIPLTILTTYLARYIYKKTGNVWLAGFINALIMLCYTSFVMNFYTDFMIPS